MDAPEADLVEKARAGDARAIEALLARYAPAVYRFGIRMCRDPEDAKDIVQETLLAASRGIRDFRGGSSVSTWLYAVARSFCAKKHRKAGSNAATRDPLEEAGDLEAKGRSPDDAAYDRELARVLEDALDALSPAHREVLLLRDVEGLTAPEVATVLEVSSEAVKSRLHRARAELRARLEPYLAEEEQPAALSHKAECPEVVALLSRYVEGEIGAAECADMERHVEGCERCRRSCASLRRTLALCRTAGDAPVPPEIQAMVKESIRAL